MWSEGTAGKAPSALFLGHGTPYMEDKDLFFHQVSPVPRTKKCVGKEGQEMTFPAAF